MSAPEAADTPETLRCCGGCTRPSSSWVIEGWGSPCDECAACECAVAKDACDELARAGCDAECRLWWACSSTVGELGAEEPALESPRRLEFRRPSPVSELSALDEPENRLLRLWRMPWCFLGDWGSSSRLNDVVGWRSMELCDGCERWCELAKAPGMFAYVCCDGDWGDACCVACSSSERLRPMDREYDFAIDGAGMLWGVRRVGGMWECCFQCLCLWSDDACR